MRIRDVTRGVEVRTLSRQSYTYYRSTRYNTKNATVTIENVYRFAAGSVAGLTFIGDVGEDALRTTSLRLPDIVPTMVEQVVSQRTYREAPAGQTPSDPAPFAGKYRPGSGWANLVAKQKAGANVSKADVAFFGDSHVSHFLTTGLTYWQQRFRHAASFGIGGDTTRQLLARIEDGLFDVYKPKTLVVSVGTNNFNDPTRSGTDQQVYDGVLKVVSELRARLPQTQLILIGLLPQTGPGQNERVQTLNTRLGEAANSHRFTYLDIYAVRLAAGDRQRQQFIGTDQHYTGRGYKYLSYYLKELIDAETGTSPSSY